MPALTTTPDRPTRGRAFLALIFAAVLVAIVGLVALQPGPASAADGGPSVWNAKGSTRNLTVKSVVGWTRPCPTGPNVKCAPKAGTVLYGTLKPGNGWTGGYGKITHVWMPKGCALWASTGQYLTPGAWNRVPKSTTYRVSRC